MVILDLGDGQKIEYEEGALRVPPPEPPKAKVPKRIGKPRPKKIGRPPKIIIMVRGHRRRFDTRTPPKINPDIHKLMESIPGFRHWMDLRREQIVKHKVRGRVLGQTPDLYPSQSDAKWVIARRKAKEDMEAIRKVIDLPDAAAEALESALGVMRSPMNQAMKLSAAKMVLDFTMAKPVAKSDVTVNVAEQWLASLGK